MLFLPGIVVVALPDIFTLMILFCTEMQNSFHRYENRIRMEPVETLPH
jgi:hypothetical protein